MVLSYWDAVVVPFYIIVLVVFANRIKNKRIKLEPEYKYFTWGLYAKIGGAIALCLMYTLYYDGGDTCNYFISTEAFARLLEKDPATFWKAYTETPSSTWINYFNNETGYPLYYWDPRSTLVSKLLLPIYYAGAKSFVTCAILFATLSYIGIWKLYKLFCDNFPKIKRELSISILFVPSVVFWGSGLMKDTITIGAVGLYAYSFHSLLIKKKYTFSNVIAILISAYLMIMIKPYIFFALLPGSLIWFSNDRLARIRNKFLRFIAAPLLLLGGFSLSFYLLSQMDDLLGVYAVDNVLERAVMVQSDLKKDYYGGNTFDIGEFDSSIPSMLAVSPKAIEATLFRPYLWDAKNVVMLLSAIENFVVLLITVFLLIRMKFIGFFFHIWKDPILLFSILFALFFAFSVGLSTPNFGALVRLKIPCIPFYLSSLFVLNFYYRDKKVMKEVVKKERAGISGGGRKLKAAI